MLNLPAFGGNVLGLKTAAAGTAFAHLVPPPTTLKRGYTRILQFGYTAGNTAHNVGVMLALGSTTTSAASNVNTNTLTLTADPGPTGNGIAANDYIAVEHSDGTVLPYTVSAWNSSVGAGSRTVCGRGPSVASCPSPFCVPQRRTMLAFSSFARSPSSVYRPTATQPRCKTTMRMSFSMMLTPLSSGPTWPRGRAVSRRHVR